MAGTRPGAQHRQILYGVGAAGSKVRVVTLGKEGLKSFIGKTVWLDLTPDEAEELARQIASATDEVRARQAQRQR